MTDCGFIAGGPDRRESLLLRSGIPDFQLTGLWNGGGTLAACTPVVPEAPFLPTTGPDEVPDPIFTLRIPGNSDRDNWGILIDPLEPGECGRVVMAGVVAARFHDVGTPSRCAAPGADGRLGFARESRCRILCLPGEVDHNDLALLMLAPPGESTASSYAGYFTLALHDAGVGESSDFRVRVVDGATYDGQTLASSGPSSCKVNNRVFSIAPWESPQLTADRTVALRFTPGAAGAADSVEPVLLASLPSDTASAAYFQLGRVLFPASGQPCVAQDHTSGVAQLWWYSLCQ